MPDTTSRRLPDNATSRRRDRIVAERQRDRDRYLDEDRQRHPRDRAWRKAGPHDQPTPGSSNGRVSPR